MKILIKLFFISILFSSLFAQTQSFKVEVTGTSENHMILLPGLSSSGEVWKETVNYYSKNYQCHNFTLAGFSGVPEVDFGTNFIEFFTNEIAKYIKENEIKKAVIMGHSLGGTLALNIAINYPDLLEKIIIVDALPFFGILMNPTATSETIKPMAENMRNMMSQGPMPEPYLTNTVKSMTNKEEKYAIIKDGLLKSSPKVVGQAYYDITVMDLREAISSIKQPVLVLAAWVAYAQMGTTHESIKKTYNDNYSKLANYKLSITDKAYHFIMFDDLEFLTKEVDQFLTK